MSPEILSHLFLLYIFEVWLHNSGVTQFDRTEKPGCAFVIHIVSAFSLEYASLVFSSTDDARTCDASTTDKHKQEKLIR